jgi:hypothetical protein
LVDAETKIRGVVVPMAWDERGNVVAIALSTHDEDEYAIDKEGRSLPMELSRKGKRKRSSES